MNRDSCCTYVVTHGWNSSAADFDTLAHKIMNHCPTCNVLSVDWKKPAASILPSETSQRIPAVAEQAHRQMEDLLGPRFDWNCITYIGHSFGNVVNRDIAGYRADAQGTVPGRDVVLDPASPLGGAPPNFAGIFRGGSLSVNTGSPLDAYPCSGVFDQNPPLRMGDHQLYMDTRGLSPRKAHDRARECFELQIPDSGTCDNPWLTGTISVPQSAAGWYDGEMNCLGSYTVTPFQDQRCDDACPFTSPQQRVLRSKLLSGETCDIPFSVPGEEKGSGQSAVVRAIDPNDKVGPGGAGAMHLLSTEEVLQYIVNFENMAEATAPVQEAVVVDYLDPNLDWTTFRFSDVAYGDRLITVPTGTVDFSTRDYPSPPTITGPTQGTMAIDITASFNTQTGRLEWRLKAIDTATGLSPEHPLAGFLPPEDGTGSGQGHVSFSIRPKFALPSGTRITNSASIVFDTNEPIGTNQVWNTIGVGEIECTGDCNGDSSVTVDELLTMVNIALGNAPVTSCQAGDASGDGDITVDEILTAVNNALNGCP